MFSIKMGTDGFLAIGEVILLDLFTPGYIVYMYIYSTNICISVLIFTYSSRVVM